MDANDQIVALISKGSRGKSVKLSRVGAGAGPTRGDVDIVE